MRKNLKSALIIVFTVMACLPIFADEYHDGPSDFSDILGDNLYDASILNEVFVFVIVLCSIAFVFNRTKSINPRKK